MNRFVFLVVVCFSFAVNAQHQDKVDFLKGTAIVKANANEKTVEGNITYTLAIRNDVDSVFLDAKNMEFEEVLLNRKKVNFNTSATHLTILNSFQKGTIDTLQLNFKATPKQTVYFVGYDDEVLGNEQIWTQGQGKYTSHWLPSFDDMEEKVEFDLHFIQDEGFKDFKLVSNGNLQSKINRKEALHWKFDMQKPMSSYLLAFVMGNYHKHQLHSASGVPIENYYYPKDRLKAEPTYRYTKEIFDFFENEIGVEYPWQNYKQVPVRDFLYAGMENTTATIFSDQFVIDSTAFIDKNYVNVNAHELAHQWFGNLVTEKNGEHHWLHEGFATYYAQLAEKEIFGDDHYYWKLYHSLQELENSIINGAGQRLTDSKASSLIFYEKGAWALYMLSAKVGDANFKKGIRNYLVNNQFKNVTIDQFLAEMETTSNQDLADFRMDWLENQGMPIKQAKNQLRDDSKSLKVLFLMEDKLRKQQNEKFDFSPYWNKTKSVHLKKRLLNTYPTAINDQLWAKAFASDTIPIRQAIARNMDTIPLALKMNFESLLDDQSYVTVENALYKLWASYPAERASYLEKTKGIVGLPNKNVRLLWLTLAVLTNEYEGRNTQKYFKELSGYTSSEYGWEIRMGAFQYLHQALGINQASLINLVDATNHHSWQFKKFARNLLDNLWLDQDYKMRLQQMN